MSVGMFNPAKVRVYLDCQIDLLLNFSDAGRFRFFTFVDLSAGKFPQPSQQPFGFAAGNQDPLIFEDNTYRDRILRRGLFFYLSGKF